jgi:hypothetical protein
MDLNGEGDALLRRLLRIISEAKEQTGDHALAISLLPLSSETRTRFLDRVHHLQTPFDINRPITILLHACIVCLDGGLKVPFKGTTMRRLLDISHNMLCFQHQFPRDVSSLHVMHACMSEVLWWAKCTAFEGSPQDVGHLQDVLPQMLHDMLRAVDASVEETFMPIVRRIARVPHTHDVLPMRIATHEAEAMHQRLEHTI